MTTDKNKKKVLIVGAKGMLGQALVETFQKDKNYKVIAWDKEDLDITRKKEADFKVKKLKPNIIINSAAYNAVDKAEDKKEYQLAKKINGLAPGYLAKIAKKIDAIFVHYSTDYVFDGQLKVNFEPPGCTHICVNCLLHKNYKPLIGYTEDSDPHPISNYGKSKLLGEKEVQKVKGKNYIIRLSRLFGKPGKSHNAKRSFFDVMLELGKNLSGDKKEIKVVNEEVSCFTYAPDLAKKTKEIIETKKPFGIYHIINSGSCTWYEAVLELYKQAKLKVKVVPVTGKEFPRRAPRPAFSVLINTELKPLRNYQSALKDYLSVLEKSQDHEKKAY